MPLIRIELFPGRSHEQKAEIAEGITRLLEEKAGVKPASTTIMFAEVEASDWFNSGKPYGAPKSEA